MFLTLYFAQYALEYNKFIRKSQNVTSPNKTMIKAFENLFSYFPGYSLIQVSLLAFVTRIIVPYVTTFID